MVIIQSEILRVNGRSRLSAYRQGVIPGYIKRYGMSLAEARFWAGKHGHLMHEDEVNNLVVSVGKAMVGDLLIDVEGTGLTYHAIGTGNTAPSAGDTALTTESARKAITAKSRSGNVLTLSTFYLAAESTYSIAEIGIFGGSTAGVTADSGKLFSHFLQTYDNSAGAFDLTFDYSITIG